MSYSFFKAQNSRMLPTMIAMSDDVFAPQNISSKRTFWGANDFCKSSGAWDIAISGSFLNWPLPDGLISFTGRYLRPPTTYKNGSPLKIFVLKRGLIWDRSQLPDKSSDIAIVVGSIGKFCVFQSEWHLNRSTNQNPISSNCVVVYGHAFLLKIR